MEGNLTEASHEWATRPDDQRFLTLDELGDAVRQRRAECWTKPVATKELTVTVEAGSLLVDAGSYPVGVRPLDEPAVMEPTHWSFSQLSTTAGAPAAYMRKLPPELAAINLQWGLDHGPERPNAMVLGHRNGHQTLRALTSTGYGRVWDEQVVDQIQQVNQDGRWVVPAASYADANPLRATTLYASDRDIFIFLVDPQNPVEAAGETLYRGFFAWNSEVGAATFGLTTFLYRSVCDNRIVWGATNVNELRIRHTRGAPERFAHEGIRALRAYTEERTDRLSGAIERAQSFELGRGEGGWQNWLKDRGFQATVARRAVENARAEQGEDRSLWDIIQGITASARSIQHTDTRVAVETQAGNLMRYVE